jgi:hypothetical protein
LTAFSLALIIALLYDSRYAALSKVHATGVLFFKNETADKCGRLMNGATGSKSLTAIDPAELKSLVLTQWKEMFARASRFQRE